MTEDKANDTNKNQGKEKFEANFETDIKSAKDSIDKMKSILLRYAPKQITISFDKLQQYAAMAEQDPRSPDLEALETELAAMAPTADADLTELLTSTLNERSNKSFADADLQLAVAEGASTDEANKMRQEEDTLNDTGEDSDKAQTELIMLGLALAAMQIKLQIDTIRVTGTSYEARKIRALDNVALLSRCTAEITVLTADYELDNLNIAKTFPNLAAVFTALAKDKNDPQGQAFLQVSDKLADRALSDAVRVLKLAIEGYVAYLFLQAQMKAMSGSELWDSPLQQSTQNMTTIIMQSLTGATGSGGNQASVFAAALLRKPISEILARRSA